MCELVDLEVADLFRVRIGPIQLGDLPERRWRVLTPDERAALVGILRVSTGQTAAICAFRVGRSAPYPATSNGR